MNRNSKKRLLTDSQILDEINEKNSDDSEELFQTSSSDEELPETPVKRRKLLSATATLPHPPSPRPRFELVVPSPQKTASTATPEVVNLDDNELPTSLISLLHLNTPTSSKSCNKNRRGGRSRSEIWKQFTKSDDGTKAWSCNYCLQLFRCPQADRLELHLRKCQQAKNLKPTTTQTGIPAPEPVSAKLAVPVSSAGKPTLFQTKIEECYQKTSELAKKRLDDQFVKVVCSANLPFNIVENKEFIAWVKLLRPSYDLPNRKLLGGPLLEKVYDCERNKFFEFAKGKFATVLQDGWKSPQGDCVIAHSLCIDKKNYFFNSHVMGEDKKTAENCLKLLEQAFIEASSIGIKLTSCVTDNCNSMVAMRRLFLQKNEKMIAYGCNSHLLNLIGKRLTPDDLMKKVIDVQKYISNHDLPRAALKNLKGLAPILPCDTRWNSQLDCVENYLRNHAKYLEISRREEFAMPIDVLQILADLTLFQDLQRICKILQPLAVSLDMLQGDAATVADAVNCWLKLRYETLLEEHFDDELHGNYFIEKFDIGTPDCAIAAYMIHPKYKGNLLSVEMKNRGRSFFRNLNSEFLNIVLSFSVMDTNIFSDFMCEDSV